MTEAAADTSVLVAALAAWHPRHEEMRHVVARRVTGAPAHCFVELYSVLTRLRAPHRISARDAGAAVDALELPVLTLSGQLQRDLVRRLAGLGITGGAVYDGVVAATAEHHGMPLLSLDRRARTTYDALGIRSEMV